MEYYLKSMNAVKSSFTIETSTDANAIQRVIDLYRSLCIDVPFKIARCDVQRLEDEYNNYWTFVFTHLGYTLVHSNLDFGSMTTTTKSWMEVAETKPSKEIG